MAVEKDDGLESLILGRRGDLLPHRELAQEILQISPFKLMGALAIHKVSEIS